MATRSPTEADALRLALDRYRTSLADAPVRSLLIEASGLPGPRANLELAMAFATEVADRAAAEPAPWWDLCRGLAAVSARRAPSGDPGEFVALCGTLGVAAVGSVVDERTPEALAATRAAAADPRWRVREGAAMAFQRLLLTHREATLAVLRSCLEGGRALELRAVVATLADAAVLRDAALADIAVVFLRQVLRRLLASDVRAAPATASLRQALGTGLGLVAAARPDDIFGMLEDLIAVRDPDGLWIARETLRKAALRERFQDRVAALERALTDAGDGRTSAS